MESRSNDTREDILHGSGLAPKVDVDLVAEAEGGQFAIRRLRYQEKMMAEHRPLLLSQVRHEHLLLVRAGYCSQGASFGPMLRTRE